MRSIWVLILLNTAALQAQELLFPGVVGEALLDSLVLNYKPPGILDYGGARNHMFREIDNESDSVRCIYTGHALYLDPSEKEPIQFLLMNNNPNGINTEHIFPQSQGAETGNARADLHHLFPARVKVNESRGSFPFGEINDNLTEHWYYRTQDLAQVPGNMIELYSEQMPGMFEPREGKKGDVARAILYFYTMYRVSANATFFESQIEDLCAWHVADPADEEEMERNQQVAVYQGRLNPFILDCTLAERTHCQGMVTCKPSSIADNMPDLKPVIYPNPGSGRLTIINHSSIELACTVFDQAGRRQADLVIYPGLQVLEIMDIPAGLFLLVFTDGTGHTYTQVYMKNW